jgi:hypothetical protein
MSTIKISQLPNASLPLSGSESVPMVQNGVTKKASVAALSSFVNVKSYGAVGDGVADDTLAVQAAINASDGVFFPTGTYKLTAAVTLKANNTVFGEGASSVILYTGTAATQGAFFTNSGSATAYINNITIRDLKFLGQVASLGFNEFIHLISMNGVRNCLIEHCVVEGFRGDGIYIGSGDLAGQERHNINVTIRDCYIDGINKDNRNGISVIDGAGITIENNYITRTSRSNMPGAIDIEPDSNTYHVIRDISILNNYISNIGGNVAAVSVFLPGVNYTTPPYGFNISGNYIENLDGLFGSSAVFFNYAVSGGLSESTAQFGIRYTNNVFRPGAARAIVVFNANDIVFEGNTIIGGGTSLIGFTPNVNVLDCTLRSNMFSDVQPAVGGAALQIFTCSRLTLDGNVFKNCGNPAGPGGGGAIIFSTGTSSALKLINNNIVSNDGSTVVAMYNDGSHTFDPDTNIFLNNNIAAGTVNFRLGSNVTPFSLGLNVPPSSWNYNYKVVEGGSSIGQGWVGFRNDSSASLLGSNCYYDGTNWRYKFNAAASFVEQENGFFVWNVATAGLAGDPITFAQPLSLNSLGLGIGTVASVYPLQVDGGAGNAAGFESNSGTVQITATDGTVTQYVGYANATSALHGTATNHNLSLIANNSVKMTVKATGQVNFEPLGSAPSGAAAGDVYYNSGTNKLQVYNGTSWVDLH